MHKTSDIGLVSSGFSLALWRQGASLALVGYPFVDSVTIKILYGVDVLLPASIIDVLLPASPHLFPLGLLKLNLNHKMS